MSLLIGLIMAFAVWFTWRGLTKNHFAPVESQTDADEFEALERDTARAIFETEVKRAKH